MMPEAHERFSSSPVFSGAKEMYEPATSLFMPEELLFISCILIVSS
jgi:hypothetical protein